MKPIVHIRPSSLGPEAHRTVSVLSPSERAAPWPLPIRSARPSRQGSMAPLLSVKDQRWNQGGCSSSFTRCMHVRLQHEALQKQDGTGNPTRPTGLSLFYAPSDGRLGRLGKSPEGPTALLPQRLCSSPLLQTRI